MWPKVARARTKTLVGQRTKILESAVVGMTPEQSISIVNEEVVRLQALARSRDDLSAGEDVF